MKKFWKVTLPVLLIAVLLTVAFAVIASASGETTNAAKVGDVEYATLAEAITAADAGATVTLLRDVTLDGAITIGKTVTVDIGAYNITSTATKGIKVAGGGINP